MKRVSGMNRKGRCSWLLPWFAFFIVQLIVVLPAAVVTARDMAESQPEPSVVAREYVHQNDTLRGYLSLPSNASESDPKPAVVFIPDSNGNFHYEQIRATMVAQEWGWIGFAADVYGVQYPESDLVANETLRRELTNRFRGDPELFAQRIHAAVDLVRDMPEVDSANVALAGYCFGGTGVLTYALTMGDEASSVRAAVSYHGGLSTLPEDTSPVVVHPKILVLSGGEDDTATQIIDLEDRLHAANATWEITRYSNVQHAFTVFDDARDRYNKWADGRSWASTHHFLLNAFDVKPYRSDPPDAVDVQPVDYKDEVDGTELRGYVSLPDEDAYLGPHPVAVILPDWDGVNKYEKQRATQLAGLGYVAFAADIYGADLQENLTFDERKALTTMYRGNETLFVRRIQKAIELATNPSYDVDMDSIGVLGYCFGGTGVIELAFSGDTSAKVVVSFHGGLRTLPEAKKDIVPYVLVLSGGVDDAHGNQTVLEGALNAGNASWEITRYSFVEHGFTKWGAEAYSLTADTRSWESMVSSFHKLMTAPVTVTATPEETSAATSIVVGIATGPLGQNFGVGALYLALWMAWVASPY